MHAMSALNAKASFYIQIEPSQHGKKVHAESFATVATNNGSTNNRDLRRRHTRTRLSAATCVKLTRRPADASASSFFWRWYLAQSSTPHTSHSTRTEIHMSSVFMPVFHFAPQPNWGFNADANMGHAFGILMAHVGTLRTSCSGAG